MSTRLANLKRHIQRKHREQGVAILQYISGNSIITPDVNISPIQIFRDDCGRKVNQRLFRDQKPTVKDNHDSLGEWLDRSIQPILKIMELRAKMNTIVPPPIAYPPAHIFQNFASPIQESNTFSTSRINNNSSGDVELHKKYEGVFGFEAFVCSICLVTSILQKGEKNISIQDIHKCDPESIKRAAGLQQWEYATELTDKIFNLPNHLFQECMEWAIWASKTNRHLYLESTKAESTKNKQFRDTYTTIHIDASSFLSKLITNPRIRPDDEELMEFLKLTKDKTEAIITYTDNTGNNNFLAVKCMIN